MKYIICSRTCSEDEYNRIIIDNVYKTGQSIQKFFRVLCDGFVRNETSICAFTVRPVGKIESGKIIIPSRDENVDGVDFHYTVNINLPVISRLYSFLASFFWFLSPFHCKSNDRVIFDPLCVLQGLGCLLACKLRGIKIVALVTDLPYIYASQSKMSPFFKKMSYWLQTHADGNIFLTEQMNVVSNPQCRPYIVVEGFADLSMGSRQNNLVNKYKKKVVLYSGGLESFYGLDMLVKGFIQADVPNSELHLYGDGGYVESIKEIAKQDNRIKYFGSRNNSEVVEAQIKATLLVNPRYTDAEYTQYSFPGKNSEYMVSGTATLTTILPGMPKEYYPYVYLLKNESVEGMAQFIQELLNKQPEELHTFGMQAKMWMLLNKSNVKQVSRIINFYNSLKK